MIRVFLSHASSDLALAEEVRDDITSEGHAVFLDSHAEGGIPLGAEWRARIYDELSRADALVCIVTGAFAASPWCVVEVAVADWTGRPVLPLVAEPGIEHPLLEHRQRADLYRDRVGALARLRTSLRLLDPSGRQGSPADTPPYPGLRAFDDSMARYFFGRGSEARRLAELLRSPAGTADARFVVVVGPSGCGKSSLVRAGVTPLIRGDPGWRVLDPVLPGADPVQALAVAAVSTGRRAGLHWSVRGIRESLEQPSGLRVLVDELSIPQGGVAGGGGSDGGSRRVLLVVDQVEELFTRAPAAARDQFCRLLADALDGELRVVASLRSEFLDRVLALAALDGVAPHPFPLRPLAPALLPLVVTEPARVAGIRVDLELTARLVNDTGGGEALPLLAFALSQLAEGVRRGETLSVKRYDELGGVHGALSRQSDAALAAARRVSGRSEEQVLAGLLRLVTIDDRGTPAARRVDRASLPRILDAEYAEFVARRLLTVHQETSSDPGVRPEDHVWVRIAHERLLSAWPPLAAALARAHTAMEAARGVEDAADAWRAAGRRDSYLWEADRLTITSAALGIPAGKAVETSNGGAVDRPTGEATETEEPARSVADHVTATAVDLSPNAFTFLTAAAERVGRLRRQARRRQASAISVLSALLVVALVAAVVAVFQQRSADEARRNAVARSLTLQANVVRAGDPVRALLLGMAAAHLSPSPATNASLTQGLLNTRYAGELARHSGGIASVAWSPDGRTLATAGGKGLVGLWDAWAPGEARQLGSFLPGHADIVWKVAWTPDSRTLISVDIQGMVRLWDVSTVTRPREVSMFRAGPDNQVYAVAVSADGTTVAARSDLGRVALWDISDPARPQSLGPALSGDDNPIHSVSLSSDGGVLAAGYWKGGLRFWDVRAAGGPRQMGPELVGDETRAIQSMAWSPDDRTLAIGTAVDHDYFSTLDGEISLVNVEAPAAAKVIDTHAAFLGGSHQGGIRSLSWSPDGAALASTNDAHTARLWDVHDRADVRSIVVPLSAHTSPVLSASWAPDGTRLATGSIDGTALRWALDAPLIPTRSTEVMDPSGQKAGSATIALSPDGQTLATLTTFVGTEVEFWDISDRRAPRRTGRVLHSDREIIGLGWLSTALVVGRSDGSYQLWDVPASGPPRPLAEPTAPEPDVVSLSWPSDGRRLLLSATRTAGFSIWDVSRPSAPHRISSLGGDKLANEVEGGMVWSPNGRLIAAVGATTITLIDVSDPSRPRPVPGRIDHPNRIDDAAWSPDGDTLATSIAGRISFWDVSDPARPRRISQVSDTSPDDLGVPAGRNLAWSEDGRVLAGSGYDRPVLWSVADRENPQLLNEPGRGSPLSKVGWLPDGRTLRTWAGSMDRPPTLWDVGALIEQFDEPLERACARLGRGLTPEEWGKLVPDLAFEETCGEHVARPATRGGMGRKEPHPG